MTDSCMELFSTDYLLLLLLFSERGSFLDFEDVFNVLRVVGVLSGFPIRHIHLHNFTIKAEAKHHNMFLQMKPSDYVIPTVNE